MGPTLLVLACLAATEPEPAQRTDFYSDPLPAGALVRCGTIRLRHPDHVYTVAFAPDGKLMATGGGDHVIRLWDTATGQLRRRLTGHEKGMHAVAFAPDDKTLVSGGNDKTVQLWDVATGEERQVLNGFEGETRSLAISPDGKLIASGHEQTIRIWDAASGKVLRKLHGHRHSIESLAFARDGKLLASGEYGGHIRLHDPATGKELAELNGHEKDVYSVAFASDGMTLATGGGDMRLWDVATRQERRVVLTGFGGTVYSITFAPDGRTLAVGSDEQVIRLIETTTGRVRISLSGHAAKVHAVAFSPDGRLVASGGADGSLRIWDLRTGEERCVRRDEGGDVNGVAFRPDSKVLASGGEATVALLWDVNSLCPERPRPALRLTADRREVLWRELADDDAAKAYGLFLRRRHRLGWQQRRLGRLGLHHRVPVAGRRLPRLDRGGRGMSKMEVDLIEDAHARRLVTHHANTDGHDDERPFGRDLAFFDIQINADLFAVGELAVDRAAEIVAAFAVDAHAQLGEGRVRRGPNIVKIGVVRPADFALVIDVARARRASDRRRRREPEATALDDHCACHAEQGRPAPPAFPVSRHSGPSCRSTRGESVPERRGRARAV